MRSAELLLYAIIAYLKKITLTTALAEASKPGILRNLCLSLIEGDGPGGARLGGVRENVEVVAAEEDPAGRCHGVNKKCMGGKKCSRTSGTQTERWHKYNTCETYLLTIKRLTLCVADVNKSKESLLLRLTRTQTN